MKGSHRQSSGSLTGRYTPSHRRKSGDAGRTTPKSVIVTSLALVPLSLAGVGCSGSTYGAVASVKLPTVSISKSVAASDFIFSGARQAIAAGLETQNAIVDGLQGPAASGFGQASTTTAQDTLQAGAYEAAQQAARIAAREGVLAHERARRILVATRMAANQAARARSLAARIAFRYQQLAALIAARSAQAALRQQQLAAQQAAQAAAASK
jgi:hypothetical protein